MFLTRRVFEKLFLKSLSQFAAISFVHFCVVFLRSLPSERFRYVCPRCYSVLYAAQPKLICHTRYGMKATRNYGTESESKRSWKTQLSAQEAKAKGPVGRSRHGSNPKDFESIALTTRPSQQGQSRLPHLIL